MTRRLERLEAVFHPLDVSAVRAALFERLLDSVPALDVARTLQRVDLIAMTTRI